MNKLSHSSVSTYHECGKKYYLHYIRKLRPVKEKSALYFGKCIDNAFNVLLTTRNLEQALQLFKEEWAKIKDLDTISFTKSDIDEELCIWAARPVDAFNSLYVKGQLFIETYYNEVLPKIKNVISVQKPVSIKNTDGDEVHGFLDLIVEWEDGRILLMDNKTSSVEYSETSAKESQQLVLYYYLEKENYKFDGVGFIVLSKKINKNKVKTCVSCGAKTTGRETSCAEEIPKQFSEGVRLARCKGSFSVSYNPTVDVQIIINEVDETDENVCIDIFDEANNGIANKEFHENEKSCIGKFGKCVYYGFCKHGNMEDLMEKNSETK